MKLNNKQLKQVANILENGTPKQKEIVRRCLEIQDAWGLGWVLKNMEEGL